MSIESQEQVNRLEYLKDLPCLTFTSFEPLLGFIKWDERMSVLDWCIIGGESGNESGKWRYRKMELSWAEELVNGSRDNNVPCFVKQLGTYQAKDMGLDDRHSGDIDEFPEHLKIREFPS